MTEFDREGGDVAGNGGDGGNTSQGGIRPSNVLIELYGAPLRILFYTTICCKVAHLLLHLLPILM